jgi:hydrogenase maturation protein HypF
VATCYTENRAGRPPAEIAARFHETVAAGAAAACAEAGGPDTVVLSGGTFQNLRLLASTTHRLTSLGFRVLAHRTVPPNDAGISYGQAAIAARKTATCV